MGRSTRRQRIKALIRRRDFLKDRVDGSEKHLSYDFQEMSALSWAIRELDKLLERERGGRDA